MYDVTPSKGPSTNALAKQGVAAIGGLAGGIALFVLGALPSLVGIIAGAVVGVVGVGALLSRDPEDKKGGAITAAAGALTILSKIKFFQPLVSLAGTLLSIGAVGLLAMGIWNGIKFFRGLKSRS